jgi:hypothetical protein
VAGAWVVRFGWVSPGRLASAGGVTGALALLHIGPAVAAGRLLDAVVALAMFCPGTLTVGALLEAMSAVLVRGVGLAWVTVPAGIVATTIPRCRELAVKPE